MRAILLNLVAVFAWGQAVRIDFLPQSLIEQRLRSYTVKNATREPAIKALFEEAGCQGELTEQTVKSTKAPNLICTLNGASDSTIVVGAHFDLVERGNGVVDNWSGASLLPSLYQGLAKSSPKHTLVFVAFTGEESGLLGSRSYLKQLGTAKSQVKAMVNMDTLGLGETKVWMSHSDRNLAIWLAAMAKQMNIPLGAIDVEKVGTSDSEPFREKNIPAITIHSLTQDTLHILHSPSDTIEAVRLGDYYQSYRLLAGYLAAIDSIVH
jgi:Iap family predicted aminopeptidase